jgi:hypothetical protein
MAPQVPGSPSIERPDGHEAGAAGELYCWINETRECNAACPAFDPRSLTPESTINPCTVLNTMRAIGISVGRLANSMTSAPAPAPPVVTMGGKL